MASRPKGTGRRYYIPITRSGSSILASLGAQFLERRFRPPMKATALGLVIFVLTLVVVIVIFQYGIPLDVSFYLIWAVMILTGVGYLVSKLLA